MLVLFFVYYAKKKFGDVTIVENYLTNNCLFKNLGLNFFLIRKLMIYVNYLTGQRISDPLEEGASHESILEEKNIFFNNSGQNNFKEVFEEFKAKIKFWKRVDFASLTESSKLHSFFDILQDFLKAPKKEIVQEIEKKNDVIVMDKKIIQNIKLIYKSHHFDINNKEIANSNFYYKSDCENYEINMNNLNNNM